MRVGAIHPKRIPLAGKKFGKLTVVKKSGNRKTGESIWECVCECGAVSHVTSSKLRKGRITTCGCGRGEAHGQAGSGIYRTWALMKRRCYNKRSREYPDYGGRGITVCERWRNSFSAFLADMGEKPSPSHSLDRYPNNDGNYEPTNCRWATILEQANNRRDNVTIEYDGKTMNAAEWSKATGIPQEMITKRLRRGWSTERALTQPLRRRSSVR